MDAVHALTVSTLLQDLGGSVWMGSDGSNGPMADPEFFRRWHSRAICQIWPWSHISRPKNVLYSCLHLIQILIFSQWIPLNYSILENCVDFITLRRELCLLDVEFAPDPLQILIKIYCQESQFQWVRPAPKMSVERHGFGPDTPKSVRGFLAFHKTGHGTAVGQRKCISRGVAKPHWKQYTQIYAIVAPRREREHALWGQGPASVIGGHSVRIGSHAMQISVLKSCLCCKFYQLRWMMNW